MTMTTATTQPAAVDQAMADLSADLAIVEAEANIARRDAQDDTGWVLDFYMKQQLGLDEALSAIDANALRLKKQIEARRKALEWKFGQTFRAESEKRIAALKKGKSVRTFFGVVGMRSVGGKPTVTITDERMAIEAAKLSAPDAVVIKESLLKDRLKELHAQGIDLPGVTIETPPKHDEFYFKPEAKALPGQAQAQLEGDEA